ncbi:TetR/AcrR family transcriptional regulator [Spirillospora sp. NPDC047279]|uniref:TetR/AcrR family transcriptional regulator n=1 Tax=Spirillospora sp. NPDC047279 TaxID=3155478 RepID=UPI0033E29F90
MGTREALIDAATRLLDEGGVDAVTLREVGARVGVSHNAPYKHFANKQSLLAAVAARELASLTTARPAGPPGEVLRAAMRGYIAWARSHPNRFKLVFGTWTADAEGLGAAAHAAQTALVGLVSSAQQAGALPAGDPVRLASLIRSLAHGAADLAAAGHLAAEGKGRADPEDLLDDLLGYLRRASDTVTDPRTA